MKRVGRKTYERSCGRRRRRTLLDECGRFGRERSGRLQDRIHQLPGLSRKTRGRTLRDSTLTRRRRTRISSHEGRFCGLRWMRSAMIRRRPPGRSCRMPWLRDCASAGKKLSPSSVRRSLHGEREDGPGVRADLRFEGDDVDVILVREIKVAEEVEDQSCDRRAESAPSSAPKESTHPEPTGPSSGRAQSSCPTSSSSRKAPEASSRVFPRHRLRGELQDWRTSPREEQRTALMTRSVVRKVRRAKVAELGTGSAREIFVVRASKRSGTTHTKSSGSSQCKRTFSACEMFSWPATRRMPDRTHLEI